MAAHYKTPVWYKTFHRQVSATHTAPATKRRSQPPSESKSADMDDEYVVIDTVPTEDTYNDIETETGMWQASLSAGSG